MQHRALSDSAWLTRAARSLAVLLFLARFLACGYSQEEWDQKVRENESLRTELTSERQARKKCESDHAAANQQIDELKKQLTERGVSLDSLSASLAEQKKALEEYQRRAEQLDAIRKRFEVLQTKLKKLTQLGLKVEVRNNRMLIQLPGDILFDSGKKSSRRTVRRSCCRWRGRPLRQRSEQAPVSGGGPH